MDTQIEKRILELQKKVCDAFKATYTPTSNSMVIGVQPNLKESQLLPINGLRHPIENNSTGWYIWTREDFPEKFVPIHTFHITEWRPEIIQYLGLPPGYRFLIDGKGYHDVWNDETLLDV